MLWKSVHLIEHNISDKIKVVYVNGGTTSRPKGTELLENFQNVYVDFTGEEECLQGLNVLVHLFMMLQNKSITQLVF